MKVLRKPWESRSIKPGRSGPTHEPGCGMRSAPNNCHFFRQAASQTTHDEENGCWMWEVGGWKILPTSHHQPPTSNPNWESSCLLTQSAFRLYSWLLLNDRFQNELRFSNGNVVRTWIFAAASRHCSGPTISLAVISTNPLWIWL